MVNTSKKDFVSEPATAEQVKEAIEKVVESKNDSTAFIYVGPSVKGLQQHSLFVGGYPLHMQEHIEKCAAFKGLFISPKKLNSFNAEKVVEGSYENLLYKQAQKYFSEVK